MDLQEQDLQLYLDLIFSWQGAEEATWKSVFYTFTGKDNKPHFASAAAQTKEALAAQIRFYRRKGRDTYVTLGSQIAVQAPREGDKPDRWPRANRFESNIRSHKTLFIDVDVGKPGAYDTLDEAMWAVDDFCAASGLPLPTLRVGSGGGLHCYWVMDTPIAKDDWKPLADALKNAVLTHGLKCDTQCTVDPCRILRVPTTYNYKIPDQPRSVVIMQDPGDLYTYSQMVGYLAAYQDAASVRMMASGPSVAERQTKFNQNFSEGFQPYTSAPADMYELANAGCGVFADAIDTGGAVHGQPLWNLMVLAATFDIEPREMAHEVSKGHPNYTVEETDAMFDRKMKEKTTRDFGWPRCTSFLNTGAHAHAICMACPHRHLNESPFTITKPKPSAQPAIDDIDLPDGFWLNDKRHIYTKAKVEKGQLPRDTCAVPYPVLSSNLHVDTGALVIGVLIGGAMRQVTINVTPQASQAETMKEYHSQRIMILEEDQKRAAWRLAVSWTKKLQEMKKRRIRPNVMGWTDDGFSYGGMLYTTAGEEPAYHTDDGIGSRYMPKGDRQAWLDAVQVVKGSPYLETIVASAFAAPLVELHGYNGLVLSAFSPESGVGKTTALKIAQAVWGAPEYMMQVNDTDNAVMKRLGDLRNLPVYYDELRKKSQLSDVSNFIFQVVQGREKQRLDSNANAKAAQAFQTIMVACSNRSLAEIMSQMDSSAAGTNRVLEFAVPVIANPTSISKVSSLIAELNRNYGQIGAEYASYLGRNRAFIKQELTRISSALETQLQPRTEDRLWLATIVVILVGAKLANDMNVAKFDLAAMYKMLTETFIEQENVRDEQIINLATPEKVIEVVDDFVRSSVNKNLIITNKIWRGAGKPPREAIKDTMYGTDPSRLTDVYAQLAVEDNMLRVEKKAFQQFVTKRELSWQMVERGLRRLPGFTTTRAAIGAGTSLGLSLYTQRYCYDIPINAEAFISDPGSSSPT